jgi:hypothetical protein
LRTLHPSAHIFDIHHITDYDLERYYLGMMPEDGAEEAAVEEHLLWCERCAARAEHNDNYVDTIRAGIILGNFDLD